MIRLFTAALTAAALAFSTPVPAAAQDGEDLARAIAGLVALGLIAKAIDDHNDRQAAARPTVEAPRYDIRRFDGPRHERRRAGPLPDQCLRRVTTADRDRERTVYARHCLKRTYAWADRLPEACERRVRTERGARTVYGARCLRRNGFTG